MLNKTGDVFVWFPPSQEALESDEAHPTLVIRAVNGNEIPCATWDYRHDTFKLPNLPELPPLRASTETEPVVQLMKIAGLDNHLIGLTNHGHVLKFDGLGGADSFTSGQWTYVSGFIHCMDGH